METKTIGHQPTLLPSFGYFAEASGGSSGGMATTAWQYPGMVSGAGQPQVPASPPLDFDKDALGQYIHKIYCRDCRMAEERQRHDVEGNRRACGTTTMSENAAILSSPHPWDQQQDDLQQPTVVSVGPLLLEPVFAADASAFLGLDKEKNKESLKRKLLLRRSAGELSDQGKHSPLKSPPSFAQHRKHLQRAQSVEHRMKGKAQGLNMPEWCVDQDAASHANISNSDSKLVKRPRITANASCTMGNGCRPTARLTQTTLAANTSPKGPHFEGVTLCDSSTPDSNAEPRSQKDAHPSDDSSNGCPNMDEIPIRFDGLDNSSAVPTSGGVSSGAHCCLTESGRELFFQNLAASSSALDADTAKGVADRACFEPRADERGHSSPLKMNVPAGITSSGAALASSSSSKTASSSASKHQGNRSNSKKTKPKVHSKTKVIKFHEYKGPPPPPSTPSSTSAAKTATTPAAASSCQGASKESRQLMTAVTASTTTADCPPPIVSCPQPAQQATSAVQAEMNGSELAQYNLMLRQQQLFLQWQLELQQKSMPVLVPMQTPSPPSSRGAQAVPVLAQAQQDVQLLSAGSVASADDAPAAEAATVLSQSSSPLPALSPQTHDQLPTTGHFPLPEVLGGSPGAAPHSLSTATQAHQQRKEIQMRIPTSLEDMKIVELKAELKQRGLPVSGSKQQLIKRLQSHQQDSRSISGDAVTIAVTALATVGAGSPLSVPSSLASPSCPSTPLTISSQSEDGYLNTQSASAVSTGSITAEDEDSRLFHGGNIFIPSPAAAQEEIVRQQQRQIEELQKLLRESQQQLCTQFQSAAVNKTPGQRKDKKSPRPKSAARVDQAANGTAQLKATLLPDRLQPPGEFDISTRAAQQSSASKARYSPRLHIAPTHSRVLLPEQMQHGAADIVSVHVPNETVVPSRNGLTAVQASVKKEPDDSSPRLCMPYGISSPGESTSATRTATKSLTTSNSFAVMATRTRHAASDEQHCKDNLLDMATSTCCSSISGKQTTDGMLDEAPSTTMDDVLEMLIAGSPDLMTGMANAREPEVTIETKPSELPESDHAMAAESPKVNQFLIMPTQAATVPSRHDSPSLSQHTANTLAEQPCPGVNTQQCLSPNSTDWSELVESADLDLDDPSITCQLNVVNVDRAHEAAQLQEIDTAGLALEDLESNLGTLDFKEEGSSSSSSNSSSSSSSALDWLDIMMQSNSVATPGTASLPLGFQNDPLLTSHPGNVADLFNMDDTDFGTLSGFSCSISWEKLQEVTTA